MSGMLYERACKQEGMGVHLNTPHPVHHNKNGRVERKFATLFNRVHAMLNSSKFSPFLRNGLWAEAANIATLLKINLHTSSRDLSPFQFFCNGK